MLPLSLAAVPCSCHRCCDWRPAVECPAAGLHGTGVPGARWCASQLVRGAISPRCNVVLLHGLTGSDQWGIQRCTNYKGVPTVNDDNIIYKRDLVLHSSWDNIKAVEEYNGCLSMKYSGIDMRIYGTHSRLIQQTGTGWAACRSRLYGFTICPTKAYPWGGARQTTRCKRFQEYVEPSLPSRSLHTMINHKLWMVHYCWSTLGCTCGCSQLEPTGMAIS